MKLNIDCARQILLAVEDKELGHVFTLNHLYEKLPGFTQDEIQYCCLKLHEGCYLDVITVPMLRSYVPGIKSINELTIYGHEFLENIREEKNYSKVKDICSKIGSFSFDVVRNVAKDVITSAIKSHFL